MLPKNDAVTIATERSVCASFLALLLLTLISALGAISPALAQNSNFNLGSVETPHAAPNSSPLTILVDGQPQIIQPGTALTPAQYVAVTQVLNSGKQSLQVGNGGVATGGSFILGTDMRKSWPDVSVPSAVTALANFTNSSHVGVESLINYGRIFAYSVSSNAANNYGTIYTKSITNHAGATISSVIPGSVIPLLGGIPIAQFNLTLSATESLRNDGVISSSGNLSISSPRFDNNGTIEAAGRFGSGSSLVTNAGTISATSLSFYGSAHSDLNVVSSGAMIATSPVGTVTFGNGTYDSVVVRGGTISGIVTSYGESVDIAATSSLRLGNLTATNGAIKVVTSTGFLEVTPGAQIESKGAGGVLLQTLDSVGGTITIGDGVSFKTRETFADNGGDIVLAIGPLPAKPQQGVAPSDVTLNESLGGLALFGNGISVFGTATANPVITAKGRDVVFSGPHGAISVGRGTLFDAGVSSLKLLSFDLANPETLAVVQHYQDRGVIGGDLVLSSEGLSGTIELDARTISISNVNGWSVPEDVALTLIGPDRPWYINVQVTPDTVTQYGNIAGDMDVRGGDLQFFVYNYKASWPDLAGPSSLVISGNVTAEADLDFGAADVLSHPPSSVIVTGNITAGGLLRLQGDNFTIADGVTIKGESIEILGCSRGVPTIIDNSGVIEATTGSISAGHRLGTPSGTILTGDGSGIWKAPSGINFIGHQINEDRPGGRTGGGFVFEADQTFMFTGANPSINFTAVNDKVIVNPGVTLDVATPGTSFTVKNALFINNGTIDLHDPQVSGSYIVLESNAPAVIVNNHGSINLGDYQIRMSAGAPLFIVAAGDIYSNSATSINMSSQTNNGGGVALYAGYEIPAINDLTPSESVFGSLDNLHQSRSIEKAGVVGSILLPKGSINNSGVHSGAVIAVASGSIDIGSITSTAEPGGYTAGVYVVAKNVRVGSLTVSGKELGADYGVRIVGGVPNESEEMGLTGLTWPHLFSSYVNFPVALADGASVSVGSINAGSVRITVAGPNSVINLPATITAASLNVNAGNGTLALGTNSLALLSNDGSGAGVMSIKASHLMYPNSATSQITFSAPNTVLLQGGDKPTITVGSGNGAWELTPQTNGAAVQTYYPSGFQMPSAETASGGASVGEASMLPSVGGVPFNAMGNTSATLQTATSFITNIDTTIQRGRNGHSGIDSSSESAVSHANDHATQPMTFDDKGAPEFVVDTELDQAVMNEISMKE